MGQSRIRRKDFDPAYQSVGTPMYWLSKRGVPRAIIADIFDKTTNDVSVNATNQSVRELEPKLVALPPLPDITRAELDIDFGHTFTYADLEARIETEASRFWREVRGLAGIAPLGEILRSINRPGRENIELLRLKARVEHLMAEMYLHAGYLKTSIRYCRRSLTTRYRLYKDTLYRTELFAYAKTMLLFTCALEVAGDMEPVLGLLEYAEAAFVAANAPIDPELHRQRASALLRRGASIKARKEYLLAYDAYPAHLDRLGFQGSDHARYDVGLRPLALIDQSHEAAMHNLAIAQAWPEGDIHRSTNLNIALASAFFTDSLATQDEALKLLPAARLAAEGYGRQMTSVHLLELIPKIPRHLRRDWALFALSYNAYRNR